MNAATTPPGAESDPDASSIERPDRPRWLDDSYGAEPPAVDLPFRARKRLIALHRTVPGVVAAALQIGIDSKAEGIETTIVDVTHLSVKTRPQGWNADMALHDWINRHDWPSRHGRISEMAAKEGLKVHRASSLIPKRYLREAEEVHKTLPINFDDLAGWTGFQGLLGQSLGSWLAADVIRDSNPSLATHKELVVRLISQFLLIRDVFANLLADCAGDTDVVVWSGRVPEYVAPWVAALEVGAPVHFYEVCAVPERYFFEEFTPFDRVRSQSSAASRFAQHSHLNPESGVISHLQARQVDSSVNPFLQPDDGVSVVSQQPHIDTKGVNPGGNTERPVVMFTTSPDELISIPGDWSTGDWSGQREAFIAAGEAMAKRGFPVIIRLHPNLVNKSWREYKEQTRAYDRRPFTVILPTDHVDSYKLIREAEAVFVWASTIGVESVAMGVPTYVLGASTYDLVADVRKIACTMDLEELDTLGYEVASESAYPAVYWELGGQARYSLGPSTSAMFRAMVLRERRYRLFSSAAQGALRLASLPNDMARSPRPWMAIGSTLVGKTRTQRLMSFVTRRWIMRGR